MEVERLFTVPCGRCGVETVGRQFGFDSDGGWYCLYQCLKCGALDWFALTGEEVVAMALGASGTTLEPKKDGHNGYL